MTMQQLSEEQIKNLFEQAQDLQEQGQFDEAFAIIEKLLSLFPNAFLLHYNAGAILFQKEEYLKSLFHYEKARGEMPDEPNLLYNLALCYKKVKQYEDAIATFEEIFQLGDHSSDILYNLAGCHRESGNLEQAAELYKLVLEIEPDDIGATNNLAYTLHRLGDTENALSMYRRVLALDPMRSAAKHMVAALSGETCATDSQYVQELFDNYSDSFETSLLEKLEYRVPELLSTFLTAHYPDRKFHHMLDIGCGTGLAAVTLAPLCTKITGFDLSRGMVEKAEEKGIYDNLVVSDITDFVVQTDQKYDLLVAADVFSYIGDLDICFSELKQVAMSDSVFLFSVEYNETDDFSIRSTGRFAHADNYIERLAGEKGLKIIGRMRENIRRESDTWIVGSLFLLHIP